jgi:hypothetical protein
MSERTRSKVGAAHDIQNASLREADAIHVDEELIKYGIEEDIWYLPFLSLCLKDITTNRDPRVREFAAHKTYPSRKCG